MSIQSIESEKDRTNEGYVYYDKGILRGNQKISFNRYTYKFDVMILSGTNY